MRHPSLRGNPANHLRPGVRPAPRRVLLAAVAVAAGFVLIVVSAVGGLMQA